MSSIRSQTLFLPSSPIGESKDHAPIITHCIFFTFFIGILSLSATSGSVGSLQSSCNKSCTDLLYAEISSIR